MNIKDILAIVFLTALLGAFLVYHLRLLKEWREERRTQSDLAGIFAILVDDKETQQIISKHKNLTELSAKELADALTPAFERKYSRKPREKCFAMIFEKSEYRIVAELKTRIEQMAAAAHLL